MAEGAGWIVTVLLTFAFLCPSTVTSYHQAITVYQDCAHDEVSLGSGQFCVDFDSVLDELESGMTLRLEPGVHVIKRSHFNDTRGMVNVSIIGSGVSKTVITCKDKLGLALVGMENLLFADFTISNCGLTGENLEFPLTLLKQVLDLFILVPLSTRVAMFMGDCKDVYMQDVHITNTTGLGLLGINIIGSSLLYGVNFTRNIRPRCLDSEPTLPSFITPGIYDQVGGGAYFLYLDYRNASEVTDSVFLALTGCYFAYNADCTYASIVNVNFPIFTTNVSLPASSKHPGLYDYTVGAGGGLSVVLANSFFGVTAIVSNTTFYQNDARYGGGAYVATFAGFVLPVSVVFLECTFEENGLAASDDIFPETYCRGGAGLAVFTDLVKPEHFIRSIPSPDNQVVSVAVADSSFTGNRAEMEGGGVMAYSLFSTPHANLDLHASNHYLIVWLFRNTTFTRNAARFSSAAFFTQLVTNGIGGSVLVILQDMTVSQNLNREQEPFVSAYEEASALHLQDVSCVFLGAENTISGNQGSAIMVESTIITFLSNTSVTFQQNLAHRGGALYFTGRSPGLVVFPNTSLEFINNQAVLEGGAIYYDALSNPFGTLQPANYYECFLGTPFFSVPGIISDPFFGLFTSDISISFTDNRAPLGGTVFGSSLESCPWARNVSHNDSLSFYQTLQGFNSTFSFSEDPAGLGQISTLPAKLIVTLLGTSEQPIAVFPGQAMKVRIQVFDIYNHTLPAVVTSVVDRSRFPASSKLGESGFWHTSIEETDLSITSSDVGLVNVSIVTATNSLTSSLSVYLKPCPLGFSIDPTSQKCTCDDLLRNVTSIFCSEDSISFTTAQNFWIGTDLEIGNPNSSDLIVDVCLLDFCERSLGSRTVEPSQFDTQCASNRAGLLCRACAEGYSIVFGTNECLQCSNYWLLLIPVFLLGGAVVFAAVALLEITIDKGWTNPVLFFVFTVTFLDFLSPTRTYIYYALPTRLLSLQLGVSTCFFNGMTTLHRSYLLFVFPLYLFVLMAIFTILCRRFTWMSVHFSPAKTLITLILMCYLSVLTTALDIIVPVRIETLGGDVSYRWRGDPNQRYFGDSAHGFLVLFAFAELFTYIIPVPLLLLFPPLAYRCLRKFSPFLDVIWAAYKPKLRFWLGIRLILVITFYLTARALPVDTRILSNIVLITFTHVQALLQPFKDKWANYADVVFSIMVVLIFWGGQAISVDDYNGSIGVGADIVYAVLLIVRYGLFILLFGLHLHRQFPSLWPKLRKAIAGIRRSMRRRKVSAVMTSAEMIDCPTMNEGRFAITRSSVHVTRSASPTRYPGMVHGTPRYRDSILSSDIIEDCV